MMRSVLLVTALAMTVLAGCSDAPPSGEFSSSRNGLTADGEAQLDYQEKVRPAGVNEQVEDTYCANQPSPAAGTCIDPYTQVDLHLMALSDPGDGNTYEAFLVGSAGEESLGMLNVDAMGMWNLSKRYDQNLDGKYSSIELRVDSLTVASTAAAEGTNTVALNASLPVSFAGSYSGKDFTVTVTGAAPGLGYTAWLVTVDPNTGELTHAEQFPVAGDGEHTFTAAMTGDKYAELHLHIGSTKLNAAIADLAS